MTYKSNFEPYVSQSSGIKDVTTMLAYSEELDPLRELYPHVSALQRQSNNEYFTEYSPSCWAEAYSMQHSLEEGSTKLSLRRISDVSGRRFVSRVRRFLGRDETGRGLHSRSSS